jgi:serine/threonine-protein kinase OSR1/STK39
MSSDWSLDADQYKFISIIGKGSFSKVLQAEYANDKKLVAVKIMDLENVSSSFEDVLQVSLIFYFLHSYF